MGRRVWVAREAFRKMQPEESIGLSSFFIGGISFGCRSLIGSRWMLLVFR